MTANSPDLNPWQYDGSDHWHSAINVSGHKVKEKEEFPRTYVPPISNWIAFLFLTLLPIQLHPLLRTTQFTNNAGDHVSLHKATPHQEHYDIQNIVNFPAGLRVMVNIGKFSSGSGRDQDLVIREDMIEWPVAFKEVWFWGKFWTCSEGSGWIRIILDLTTSEVEH